MGIEKFRRKLLVVDTEVPGESGTPTVAWDDVTDKPTTFPPVAGAAVANATDEATAVTQLNALLASLRASGAIAT